MANTYDMFVLDEPPSNHVHANTVQNFKICEILILRFNLRFFECTKLLTMGGFALSYPISKHIIFKANLGLAS